jgi:hypothetical protein
VPDRTIAETVANVVHRAQGTFCLASVSVEQTGLAGLVLTHEVGDADA